jgi:hypothetical protein
VNPIRERLEAIYCWFYNRLSGSRCFAEGCGRRVIWHTPRQWNRCLDTPLGIKLTDRGWLRSNGIDPDSEPVVPVSQAKPA